MIPAVRFVNFSIMSHECERQKTYERFKFISKINQIVINDKFHIKLKPTSNYDWDFGIKCVTGGSFLQRLILDLPPDEWTIVEQKNGCYKQRSSEFWEWKTKKSREIENVVFGNKSYFTITINETDIKVNYCNTEKYSHQAYHKYEFTNGYILFEFDISKLYLHQIALRSVFVCENIN